MPSVAVAKVDDLSMFALKHPPKGLRCKRREGNADEYYELETKLVRPPRSFFDLFSPRTVAGMHGCVLRRGSDNNRIQVYDPEWLPQITEMARAYEAYSGETVEIKIVERS